jgi:hypothetical protein
MQYGYVKELSVKGEDPARQPDSEGRNGTSHEMSPSFATLFHSRHLHAHWQPCGASSKGSPAPYSSKHAIISRLTMEEPAGDHGS